MKSSFMWKMFFGIASVLALSSCSLDDGGTYYQDTMAHVTIGNASPGTGDVYFFADNNLVNQYGLGFGDAAGYYNFYQGDRTLSVKSMSGELLATKDVNLSIGAFYTIFTVNEASNMDLAVFKDSLVEPIAGSARIRFINLSPDAPAIDILNGTDEVASDVAFKEASQFIDVPAGAYEFRARLSSADAFLGSKQVQLSAGRIYTFYTKGSAAVPSDPAFPFGIEGIYNY